MKARNNKINIDKSLLQEQLKSIIEVYKRGIVDKKAEKVIIKYKENVIAMQEKLIKAEVEFIPFDFDEVIRGQSPFNGVLEEEKQVTIPYKNKIKRCLIGVYVVKSNSEEISRLANKTGRSKNDIVNRVLNQIFDTETGKLTVDIEANKKEKVKLTSFLINERIKEVIKEEAEKKNMSDTEFFNKLLEKSINKYFK